MGNKVSSGSETRLIEVGIVRLQDEKKHNKIKTTRYTLITFLPKNMIEQFRRIANFYFLLLTVLAFMINSPVSPFSTLIPLLFVVFVTAVKQGYEDFLRHRSDNAVNNEKVEVISKNTVQKVRSHEVRPGTLVRVRRGHDVPADLVLIYSSDPDGKCHVTTANLDGETNLKTLRVPAPLVGHTPEILSNGVKVEVPSPMTDLYTFYGRIDLPENSLALGIENLMLRGSRVKNTEWAIGCAVYTGEETKLALNSRFSSNKFTACERKVNVYLLLFIAVLIASILISFGLKLLVERATGMHDFYLGPSDPLTTLTALQDIFSFLLLFYYLIPISLYVTIEMYKFVGSLFIKWDDELTCHSTNQPAIANTSDLNEELGQVEILFSDKTGTLTKNIMNFKMCSINGKIYEERLGQLFDNSSWNEPEDTFKPDLKFFFTILALCHTVQVGDDFRRSSTMKKSASGNFLSKLRWRKPKSDMSLLNEEVIDTQIYLKYQASSPDEKALVEAAARANATFLGESGKYLQVDYGNGNIENYELLQVLEFTSERKRMSVIIRDKDQKIWLYCKGAESSVLPLCIDSPLIEVTNKHVDKFARQGLRTLAIAYRPISNEEYERLLEDLNKLRSTASTEASLKELVTHYRKLEQGLLLAGATAVEDLLQDNVSETLSSLRKAGMRIWVLTGDKVETAINVAQSCSHMPEHTQMMFLVDIKTDEAMQLQLNECLLNIANSLDHNVTLIIDGQSLARILGNSDEEALFLEISLFCTAVLCCRLSPLQKAEIVRLIKNSAEKPITAAIGDGANDISMIQEAHVGIGLFGKEGRQAARSADYAFSDFCMLRKLLLVSGHWYYQRLATLVLYFFYKNITFVLLMFYFQINSQFSTHSIFDSMFLACYNLFFTSLPCFILSVTEQCKPQKELLSEPELYQSNRKNKLMSWFHLASWTLAAIYHSMMIYMVSWYLFGPPVVNLDGTVVDIWCFSIVLYNYLIIVVNFKLWLQARYQTTILVASIFISIVLFLVMNIAYTFIVIEATMHLLGTYERLLTAPAFYFGGIIVVCLALLPDFCLRLFRNVYKQGKKRRSQLNDDDVTQSTAL